MKGNLKKKKQLFLFYQVPPCFKEVPSKTLIYFVTDKKFNLAKAEQSFWKPYLFELCKIYHT